jgi:hypothetical protein
MCTLLSILFYYGPLCVPYSLFCFIMDHYVYPTLYFALLWTIMCTLLSIKNKIESSVHILVHYKTK